MPIVAVIDGVGRRFGVEMSSLEPVHGHPLPLQVHQLKDLTIEFAGCSNCEQYWIIVRHKTRTSQIFNRSTACDRCAASLDNVDDSRSIIRAPAGFEIRPLCDEARGIAHISVSGKRLSNSANWRFKKAVNNDE
jgi:hypothetical protein